ncbi:MAG: tRNA uridine-5-carboxymethylaminomethyl(34) synthesis GTPase MnmE [Candidatus Omnitrophota bacterium]|nr:tRNA uridine-5-carboxymethylaminomethyl(34) synthesis GTPase MnmE [Candidatus Omnitrophota bacterium]
MPKLKPIKKESFFDDTIAAISTAFGQAGIGIVRLSGHDALSIADRIFISGEKKKPSQCQTYTIHYGWIAEGADKNRVIDEAILTIMRSPRSYTREDVVEINCHSGIVPLRKIYELVLKCGARPAEAGEFTRRAFVNGRIDLVQAESVLDIIQSRTEASLELGINQLQGRLSKKIEEIRSQLLEIFAHLEAAIDFPEEDIKTAGRKKLLNDLEKAALIINRILDFATEGKILREGISVVIYGKPNVGKSSLLNALLKEERAIVTHIPGTTKDTVEECANIAGIPLRLIDTAGIDRPKDLIDEEAIKRSRQSMANADLILFVLDSSRGIDQQDKEVFRQIANKNVIVVVNKIDLKRGMNSATLNQLAAKRKVARVSALKDTGIRGLEKIISETVFQGKIKPAEDILISNLRHINLLRLAQRAIQKTQGAFKEKLSVEFVSQELKEALLSLDKITGRAISEDLLDKIFSEFCIGK